MRIEGISSDAGKEASDLQRCSSVMATASKSAPTLNHLSPALIATSFPLIMRFLIRPDSSNVQSLIGRQVSIPRVSNEEASSPQAHTSCTTDQTRRVCRSIRKRTDKGSYVSSSCEDGNPIENPSDLNSNLVIGECKKLLAQAVSWSMTAVYPAMRTHT